MKTYLLIKKIFVTKQARTMNDNLFLKGKYHPRIFSDLNKKTSNTKININPISKIISLPSSLKKTEEKANNAGRIPINNLNCCFFCDLTKSELVNTNPQWGAPKKLKIVKP